MTLHPYQRRWITEEGAEYRLDLFERQRKGGSNPLTDNPTVEEIAAELRKYEPRRVLEVGCGWGRLLEDLIGEFDAYGCDISADLLRRAEPVLSAKLLAIDIAEDDPELASMYKGSFDVLFTRSVMQELIDDPELTLRALGNLELLANRKVLFWERAEVCDALRSLTSSDRFTFFPIRDRTE